MNRSATPDDGSDGLDRSPTGAGDDLTPDQTARSELPFSEQDGTIPAQHQDVSDAGHPPHDGISPAGSTMPAPQAAYRRRYRRLLLIVAIFAVLAASIGTALVVRLGTGEATADETRTEPVQTPGDNPFMPAVGADAGNVTPPQQTGGSFPGDTPGLYGGTLNNASCDANAMVSFLQSQPDKAEAWAAVLGITSAEIPNYVADLTPVILRSDTAVTNHGFVDGHASTLNSVLQAGTAVLVDKYGVPRARCYCGNPLTPATGSPQRYIGSTWQGFSPTSITIVQPSTAPIIQFTLVNPATNEILYRPRGPNAQHDRTANPPTPPTSTQTTLASATQPEPPQPPATETTQPEPPQPVVDWRNRAYTTDCDGYVQAPFTVDVRVGGDNRVSGPGGDYVLEIRNVVSGDLTGDGHDETAVLIRCYPTVGHWYTDEIQLFTDGAKQLMPTLKASALPHQTAGLEPQFDGDPFAIEGGQLSVGATFYVNGDSKASGPSQHSTVSWKYDGSTSELQLVNGGEPAKGVGQTDSQFTVSAAKDWQDTGVILHGGETVTISYVSGEWSPWPGGNLDAKGCLQAGCSQDPNQPENICCMAHAGLLGRIGEGAPFAVGMGTTIPNVGPGTVQLRINDLQLNDNSGELTVNISTQG